MSETRERRLGVFRIESGEGLFGSQGAVYRAVCEEPFPGVSVGETVALKTMPGEEEPGRQERFRQRVAELAKFRSDHVVGYRGCFTVARPFQTQNVIVMDWLDGETLKDRLAREPGGLDADVALKVADGLLAGLAAAQAAGLVHRDVKPGNVFLCRDGSVKLIDFEVAHRAATTAQSSTGGFAGTFDYMAPEFADPTFPGTFASDVFSAGVVMHEALTGQVPYTRKPEKGEQADFAFLSRWSQRKEGLCAIRIRSCVKRVLSHADEVLQKALAENPDERWPDAASFRAALRQIRYREVRSSTESYRLLRLVGEGGFGCVYKARARGAGRFVAVKQLKRPEFGDRFRREARVMQRLDDSALVRFVDYFETREIGSVGAFLVMDYLPGMPGSSLRDAIRSAGEAPLSIRDVITAFTRYARALSLLHRLRIYHRDIKPSNLYYPRADPSRAAVMDLGIARDVSGTATAGQVPGTLDYMPPEVVLGGSRGDAGMDIYALGLCLYEAVSGKTAYPRLPTGAAAFPAFYDRARSRRPPSFDAPCVEARPRLAALLREMTALDPRERLQDAEILRRRLASVAVEVPGAPVESVRPVACRALAPATEMRPTLHDPQTEVTAEGCESPPQLHAWLQRLRLSRRNLAVAVSAAAALVVVAVAWKPVAGWAVAIREKLRAENVEKIRRIEEARCKAEEKRVRQEAQGEAELVLAAFASKGVTSAGADAKASEWRLKWRSEPRVADLVTRFDGEFSLARSKRIEQDRIDAENARQTKARKEQADIIVLLRGTNETTAVCDAHIRNWKETWRDAIKTNVYSKMEQKLSEVLFERKNRDVQIAQKEKERQRMLDLMRRQADNAVAEAQQVETAYGDEKTPLATADAAYSSWQSVWRNVLEMKDVRAASERILSARKRRAGADAGIEVVAECSRSLDNILLVGADDVEKWGELVDHAESALQKAERVGGISPGQAAAVRERISQCRKWVVGVIDNKSDRLVEFGGRKIGPVSAETVVFTNGYPAGASVLCEGCEPIRVLEKAFSAGVFRVMPRDLELRACETHATLPPYPTNVLCLVDGVERKSGDIRLRRGPHSVKYWRREETFPGTKDYEPKEFTFETHLATVAEVPSPAGDWVVSVEYRRVRQQHELVKQGREIEADCRRLMEPLPLETRRARLEQVHARLADWKTASALGVLGVGTERALRAAYDAECRRIRGFVLNSTSVALTVLTDGEPVAVPPGQKVLVTFERRWPADARIVITGYEFVLLPREPAAFDGQILEVRPEKLVPLPVWVTVPSAGEDVSCQVDGKAVTGKIELRPGQHEVVWSKRDHVSQKQSFDVEFSTPRTLPLPGKWEPTGALGGLVAAFRAFNDGAVDAAKKISDDIGDIEDPKRRRELEELKRAIELRKKLERKD